MATMSPLRRRMIEDMTVRNLSRSTQQSYIYAVAKFSRHFVSGHAAAAPPSSVMNSRRFMGSPPQAGSRTLPHRCARTLLCSAARLLIEWQRWVNRVEGTHGRPTLSVRSTPNSDRKLRGLGLRRKVPQPAVSRCSNSRARKAELFDHFVGAQHEGGGNLVTDLLCGPEIDDQPEVGRLLDWQIGGFCAA
jgi:hypothetical protein